MDIAHRSDLPPRTEAGQRSFFDSVHAKALEAKARVGAAEQDIKVAGTTIRLSFGGTAMRDQLLPALSHLCVAAVENPDLVLHIWESASSGVSLPPPPCPTTCFTDRGDIWTFASRHVRSAFHWSEYSLSLLDVEGGEGIFWVRSLEALPYWTLASPFRTLFHWWMEARGAQLLHAAAVGIGGDGVLITGRGGVGKSTTALTCLQAGFSYVADDYLVLTLDPEPVAHSLYCTAKVNPDASGEFAKYQPRLLGRQSQNDEKAVMFLHPAEAASLVPSLRLRSVATPAFAQGDASHLASSSPQSMLAAATFTTLCQLPHAGQKLIDFATSLLERLPCYTIELGREPEGVVAAVEAACLTSASAIATRKVGRLPLISVVIPVHNGLRFLAEAVTSILDQDYPALEILVVDDGCLGDIEAAVRTLPVDVRLIRQGNEGPAGARNRGICDASGELIAFLDVDDLWPAGKLHGALEVLERHRDIDVVTGHAQLMERSGDGSGWRGIGDPTQSFPHYIGAGVYRRTVFDRIGMFDPRLRFAEDTDWYARAADLGVRIERLPATTLFVRRHEENMTAGTSRLDVTPLRLVKNALDRRRSNRDAGKV